MQTLRTRGLSHHRHCITCGYDLTGLPNLKCPECGKSFDRDLPIVQAPRYSVDWRLLGFVYLALIAVVAYATFTDYDELPLWLTYVMGVVECSPVLIVAVLIGRPLASSKWGIALPWFVLAAFAVFLFLVSGKH